MGQEGERGVQKERVGQERMGVRREREWGERRESGARGERVVREWRERVGKRIVGERRVWIEERKSGVRGKMGQVG